MKKLLKKRLKNEKGLTLVELLAVVVILGIVAAIAIPAIGNIIENSKYNGVKADAINVLNAANIYFTENDDEKKVTLAKLESEGYLDTAGALKKAKTVTINKEKGKIKLTTDSIVYSGSKTVKFNKASIDDINKDPNKGSSDGNKEIKEASSNSN